MKLLALLFHLSAVLLLSVPPALGSNVPSLLVLSPDSDPSMLQRAATTLPVLDELLKSPAAQDVKLANVNAGLVAKETRLLSVTLPDGKRVDFQLRQFKTGSIPVIPGFSAYSHEVNVSYWFGDASTDRRKRFRSADEVEVDLSNTLFLARYDDQVQGTLLVDGQPYRILYVGANKHALVKLDIAHSAECGVVRDEVQSAERRSAERRSSAKSLIRVTLISTPEAYDQPRGQPGGSIGWMIEQIERLNMIYASNGVNIAFDYGVDIRDLDDDPNRRDPIALLRDLRNGATDKTRAVQAQRERVKADIVVVAVFGIDYNLQGRTYAKARKETAYAVVNPRAGFTNFYAFNHTFGHLMGLEHTWTPDAPVFDPPYPHAYLIPQSANVFLATIGYDFHVEGCNNGTVPKCIESDFISNPLKLYQGVRMGIFGRANGVRFLNERGPVISSFY